MLTKEEAVKKFKKVAPDRKVQIVIEYKDLYLIQAFSNLPFEEELDPFFSVNKDTGQVKDFSIITDGDGTEIIAAFVKAKQGGR